MTRLSLQWLLVPVCLWCVCGVCITVVSSLERTHIFVDKTSNRQEAAQFCKEHHVSLSSILTEADYQKLRRLDYRQAGSAWIGLYLGPQSWTWTNRSKTGFYNWRRWPSTCGALSSNGIWVNRYCSTPLPYICETGQGKYINFIEQKTWEQANSDCVYKGHILATFKNASTKPEEWPDSPHWMGLKRASAGWTWVDEVEGKNRAVLSYSNWRTVNFCGLMYANGEWGDRACHELYSSVCSDGQKYELTKETLSWHKAQQKCQDKNMHLVSIHNASQNTHLRNKFVGVEEFWIGLYDNAWTWPDGSSAQLQYWGNWQPSRSRNSNHQCVRTDEGKWNDVSCSDRLPFFCLMRPQEKLKVLTGPSSWEEALLHCRGLGGDLASVGNHSSQMLIQQVVQAAMTTHVWMGLRFLVGEWLWVNKMSMDYQRWAGQKQICPLHHCGAINRTTGYWEPRSCREKLDFLCQLP